MILFGSNTNAPLNASVGSISDATLKLLTLGDGSPLAVASHTVPAPSSSRHVLTAASLGTELWTIPAAPARQLLLLSCDVASEGNITIINGNGNLQTGLDYAFDHAGDRLLLESDGTNWVKVAPGSHSVA